MSFNRSVAEATNAGIEEAESGVDPVSIKRHYLAPELGNKSLLSAVFGPKVREIFPPTLEESTLRAYNGAVNIHPPESSTSQSAA